MSERPPEAGDEPTTAQQGGETEDGRDAEHEPPDAGTGAVEGEDADTGAVEGDETSTGEPPAEGARAGGEPPEDGDGAGSVAPEDGERADGGIGAGIVALGIVLVLVVSLANVAIAVDSTVLDEDHVVETMDDEGVFAAVTDQARESTAEGINDSIDDQQREFLPPDTDEQIEDIANASVTEAYIREEIVRNIENFYAYLHDEESDIRLAMDLTEPKENAITEIEERGMDLYIDTDAVRNELPDEQNLTTEGEPPEEMDDAQTAVSIIGWLTILLPLLALGLIGGIYHVTSSVQRTANTSGAALLVAGVIGLIIGYGLGGIASDEVESAFGADDEFAAAFSDGSVAVVESLFETIASQSLIIAVAGAVLLGLVYADREGYLDSLKSDDEEGPQAQGQQGAYQQGEQDQYQQQQYQQGQQGQQVGYQQGGQGQYQQQQYQHGGTDQYQHGGQGQGQPGPQGGSDDLYYDPDGDGDAGDGDQQADVAGTEEPPDSADEYDEGPDPETDSSRDTRGE